MIEEQFLSCFSYIGLSIFSLPATSDDGAALEGRGGAVENENGLSA